MKTRDLTKEEAAVRTVYKMIHSRASSNAFIQGVSGIGGFPSTLAIDAVVLLTHYEPMINEIRSIYGRSRLTAKDFAAATGGLYKELLVDLMTDKLLGNVPVLGVYFNAISAKALTWRLGMVAAVLSSRGEEFNRRNVADVIKLISYATAQRNMFRFRKPDYEFFRKIVLSVSDNDVTTFEDKLARAISAFE